MRASSSQSQILLFDLPSTGIVNVASVRQLSPFRYPGGKTWFVPRVRQWLASRQSKPTLFVEPFAGGAIVGLSAAFERLADCVLLCELDAEVAAVWRVLIEGDAELLAERILRFDCELDTVREEVSRTDGDLESIAFRTILKNRTYHGGILAKGSSLMKSGENGRGVASRWYPETLAQRIRTIVAMRERLRFVQGDALELIRTNGSNQGAVFFVDPPYTAAGKRAGSRLYNHHQLDHEALFDAVCAVRGDFVMTYDVSDDLIQMARARGLQTKLVPMKNTHNAEMTELVVGRNLDWLR